jgi:transcriptional regulator with PAS, ATPase and Fis domain
VTARVLDPWHCTLDDFASEDAPMRRCLDLARAAAQTDLPVLILGESGTGKTLLARAVHNSSKRAAGPFVSFNAAALSDTLLDSQLFGHDKGAFTGAQKAVKGKFELAHGGTLFIDEIADLSPVAQAKILRAVEYGEFERLGSERLQVADVRLVSATHLPLVAYTESDRFRKDLFYRIGGITLTIPPLRERPDDLKALVVAELAAASRQQGKTVNGLSRAAADLITSYSWPGNLRELKRVLHAAVAMTSSDTVPREALALDAVTARPAPSADVRATAAAAGGSGSSALDGLDGDLTLQAAEARHIRAVLDRMGGNKRRAARALGVSRSTLDRKLGA